MTRGERAAVHRLLRAGRVLLQKGLPREAADVFGRVLLKDPRRDAARRGLAQARRLAAEEARIHEARLAELRRKPSGRSSLFARRRYWPNVLMMNALERRRHRASSDSGFQSADASITTRKAKKASSRRALVAVCAVVYVTLLGVAALHWERFVETLVRIPSPIRSNAQITVFPGRTKGERAVTEALRLMERGDAASARSLLEMIPQSDPAYPFSRHLRRRLMLLRVEP